MEKVTKRENGTLKVQTVPEGKSLTEQSHRDRVNINKIVAKARKGIPPRVQEGPGLYGDFTSGMSFHEMQNRVADARGDFMALPSEVRKRFENDPGKLLDFIADPNNRQEAMELGLLPKPPEKVLAVGEPIEPSPEKNVADPTIAGDAT